MAIMESVEEENDENADPESNLACVEDEFAEDSDVLLCSEFPSTKKLNAITASDKLGMACFRMVTKNSCLLPNCEYSHDNSIVAAARDKQIADLTETKRAIQSGHQAASSSTDSIMATVLRGHLW